MSSAGSRLWTPTTVRLTADDAAAAGDRADRDHRRAPSARRAGGARSAADHPLHDLQRHALPGWLAWHEPLGEWTLRAGGGFTGRANSCHAVGDPGVPIQQAAERIIAYAAAHGIAPMAQVIERFARGARRCGARLGRAPTQPTAVLAAGLAEFLARPPVSRGRRSPRNWSPTGRRPIQRSRPNSADPTMVRMILDGSPPRAFAAAADDHD